MNRENVTEFIILGLLMHEPSSGYDLKKKIDLMISNFWTVGYGQLYPTLKDLVAEGNITGSAEESTKGPERILYTITARGKEKLLGWLAIPASKEYIKYEILLKLFFGSLLTPAQNLEKIEAFRQSSQEKLDQVQLFKANLAPIVDENIDHLYFYLTVLFGEHIYQAYLDWAGQAASLLSQSALKVEEK